VLHTLGSHFSYADRYPDSFDLFQPSGKGEALGMHNKANKEKLNNAYDNTVAYTDYVVFNLIRQLEKQQAVSGLMLVSDHGENLFDGDCDKSGHGHNTEFDYRVAALWWSSEAFKNRYAAQQQRLTERRNAPLLTSQTFHTLLDVAQIRYANERSEQSIASATFTPQRRILASGIDFDATKRLGSCRVLPSPVAP
jgi:glucan phosphoethanolaminetransferase (alkaline phosphatase superfamily)